jgi:hypothetical protein
MKRFVWWIFRFFRNEAKGDAGTEREGSEWLVYQQQAALKITVTPSALERELPPLIYLYHLTQPPLQQPP